MSIELQVDGDLDVTLKLQSLPDRLRDELYTAMKTVMFDLQSYIQTNKLSGQVLNRRSGTLSRSFTNDVEQGENIIEGTTGPNTPYARIQEYGGQTAPHVIEARNVKALMFTAGGKTLFRRLVHHPGSRIPERSYMRTALAENINTIRNQLNDAVKKAIAS